MRKQVLIIAAVSAIVLFVFYLIGALSNTDKIHDIHAGIEDRAIMQSNNTVYAGQVEQYGILHVDSATAYADDEFVRFAEKAAEFWKQGLQELNLLRFRPFVGSLNGEVADTAILFTK